MATANFGRLHDQLQSGGRQRVFAGDVAERLDLSIGRPMSIVERAGKVIVCSPNIACYVTYDSQLQGGTFRSFVYVDEYALRRRPVEHDPLLLLPVCQLVIECKPTTQSHQIAKQARGRMLQQGAKNYYITSQIYSIAGHSKPAISIYSSRKTALAPPAYLL